MGLLSHSSSLEDKSKNNHEVFLCCKVQFGEESQLSSILEGINSMLAHKDDFISVH